MSQQKNGHKQEEQEGESNEPIGQPVFPDRGPDRDKMAANYLPEGEEWSAKTVLDVNDPAALAALSQFGELYPEVGDLQEIIDGFSEEFLKSKTSVGGRSRQEYESIIRSMFGDSGKGDSSSSALKLVAADEED